MFLNVCRNKLSNLSDKKPLLWYLGLFLNYAQQRSVLRSLGYYSVVVHIWILFFFLFLTHFLLLQTPDCWLSASLRCNLTQFYWKALQMVANTSSLPSADTTTRDRYTRARESLFGPLANTTPLFQYRKPGHVFLC